MDKNRASWEEVLGQKPPDNTELLLYHYYKNLEDNIFYINGVITPDIIDLVGIPLLKADKENYKPIEIMARTGNGDLIQVGEFEPEDPREITIYMNTDGGDVYSGFILCDIISRLQTPTTICVIGAARSMGAYILMAGANNPNVKRVCYPFSTGLIHDGGGIMEGTHSQIKDYYSFLDKYQQKIKDFVLENSKITEEQFQSIERHEWYLTAQDMLKYGLVDEIL